jgi:hypothetical protein
LILRHQREGKRRQKNKKNQLPYFSHQQTNFLVDFDLTLQIRGSFRKHSRLVPEKLKCFVSGHDLSRAAKAATSGSGFSPCQPRSTKRPWLRKFAARLICSPPRPAAQQQPHSLH